MNSIYRAPGVETMRTLVVVFLGGLEVEDPLRRGVGLPPQQQQDGRDGQQAEHQPGAHGRAPEPAAPAPRLLQLLRGVVDRRRRPRRPLLRLQHAAEGQPLLVAPAPVAIALPPHHHELIKQRPSPYAPHICSLAPSVLGLVLCASAALCSLLVGDGVVKVGRPSTAWEKFCRTCHGWPRALY